MKLGKNNNNVYTVCAVSLCVNMPVTIHNASTDAAETGTATHKKRFFFFCCCFWKSMKIRHSVCSVASVMARKIFSEFFFLFSNKLSFF